MSVSYLASTAPDELPDLDTEDGEHSGNAQQVEQPLYRVYEGSKIAVSKQVGKMWKRRFDAAVVAHEHVNNVWEECFKYYNFDHIRTLTTTKGAYKRGDGTENIIFSNLNVMLPAVYGKDPDVTCNTIDEQDEPFCKAMQALINALFRRRDGLKAKPKIKRATGFALLTNQGVLKLDFQQKDDSRELAMAQMEAFTQELAQADTQDEVDEIYGRLEALEMNMEVLKPSGFKLSSLLPHNLIVDPYAEEQDAMDSDWMIERVFYQTNTLTARYTKPEDDSDEESERVLIYAPTHKAVFAPNDASSGERQDDGLGIVMEAIDGKGARPQSHTDTERTAYVDMFYSECYLIWDKIFRRVYLFHRDDWTWPIWVFDDPLNITRFFPYFVISTAFSTGASTSVGEVAYCLDQQDEINDINRQKAKIRRSIFDYFYYNSDKIDAEEAEKFIKALRGEGTGNKNILGVKAGEGKIADSIEAVAPPILDKYEFLFDTASIRDTVNRVTNTSDAIRGVQFKTNTNVAAVNSYEQSLRLSVGSKVDVIEDVVADLALAVGEICVQNYDQATVAGYIGPALAEGWQQMDLNEFNSQYTLDVVAGSMEKPNSVFKKKEATEIVQSIGQFARAAPGATLVVALRVLEQAFTEVVIKPEDWAAIKQETQANLQRGAGGPGGDPGQQQGQQQDPAQLVAQMDPAVKQQVVKMHQQGAPEQQIVQFIQQHAQQHAQQNPNGGAPQNAQTQPRQ